MRTYLPLKIISLLSAFAIVCACSPDTKMVRGTSTSSSTAPGLSNYNARITEKTKHNCYGFTC